MLALVSTKSVSGKALGVGSGVMGRPSNIWEAVALVVVFMSI